MNALAEPLLWTVIFLTSTQNDCKLDDLQKFPSEQQAREVCSFQCELSSYIDTQLAYYPPSHHKHDFYENYKEELNKSYYAWTALLRSYTTQSYPWGGSRALESLKELRECIGDSNYFLGQMPSVAPWHKFNQVER